MLLFSTKCQFQKKNALDRHDVTAELTQSQLIVKNGNIQHAFPCASLHGKIKMAANPHGTFFMIKDSGAQYALQFPLSSSGVAAFTTVLAGQGLLVNPPPTPMAAPAAMAGVGFIAAGAAGATSRLEAYSN